MGAWSASVGAPEDGGKVEVSWLPRVALKKLVCVCMCVGGGGEIGIVSQKPIL